MYDLGDPVGLAVSITDSSGNPADAGAVTATVTLPDGTTATPTVNHPGVGQYTATYTPTVIGRHNVRWVATGANASAFNDVFDVRAGLSTSLLSLADARKALNIDDSDTSQDEEIRDYLEAITDVIEGYTDAIVDRTVVEQVSSYGSMLTLSTLPVKSITSINNVQTSGWSQQLADLVVDPTTGIIRRLSRGTFGGEVYTVTYVAGRGNIVPPALALAARIILKNVWAPQRGRGRGENTDEMVPAYLIPYRAMSLIRKHRIRVGGIA